MNGRIYILINLLILCSLCTYAADLGFTFTVENVTCYNSNNGRLNMIIQNGSFPVEYKLCKLVKSQQQIIKKGIVENETLNFENLEADTLYIEIKDVTGHVATDTIIISQPEPLKAGIITIIEVNNNIGKLKANQIGGQAPFTYKWTSSYGGFEGEIIENAKEGIYKVDINDANNCGPVQATIFFVRQQYPEYFK